MDVKTGVIGLPQASFTAGGVGVVASATQATNEDPPVGGTKGGEVALEKVTVCDCVPVLPQSSVAVHVFVTEYVQPLTKISGPSTPVAIRLVEQLSVTLAVPKAADICATVGLQFNVLAGVIVITGSSTSLV